jgi:hypothetical protein
MSRTYLEANFEKNQNHSSQQRQELPNYHAEFAAQARKLCLLGLTDIELADFFDITREIFNTWRAQHKEFSDAIRIARESANGRVERSLYQCACGYERDTIRIVRGRDKVTIVHHREHVPGEVAAQLKWLVARRSDRWGPNAVVERNPERTSAEIADDLIRFLIEQGVRIALPEEQDIDADGTVSRSTAAAEIGDENDRRGIRETRRKHFHPGTKRLRTCK